MRNRDTWTPSKFVYRSGRLRASVDPAEVNVSSRLVADITAAMYGEHLGRYARGKLADLGCGKVPLYAAYRDHVTDTTCVDWQNTLHANAHLDYECDLTQRLPLADESHDTVILSDVLEHVPEPEKLWREVARILTPSGVLLANVPFYYWLHEAPNDYYRYTEFALRRFAARAGFEVEVLETMGGSPEILADVIAKNLATIPRAGRFLAGLTMHAAQAFLGTGLGRKISRRTKRKFPLGYFLVARKRAAS